MRENNKLTSLLKYICITTSVSCAFVLPAKADFDARAFISDILSYENPDHVEKEGDVVVVNFWGDLFSYVDEGTQMCLSADWDEEDCGGTSIRSLDADANEWAIHWAGHGTLYGIGACSTSKGATSLYEYEPGKYDEYPTYQIDWQTFTTSDDITDDGGNYLWCKMTGVADTGGNDPIVPSGSQWVFVENFCDEGYAATYCASYMMSYQVLRSVLFDGASFASPMPPKITVASTAYIESKFSPISTKLNTTIGKIEKVVENTIKQSDRISALHTGKQNRPDDYNDNEKCPVGRDCLLITEADGSLHWYPICDANGSVEAIYWLPVLRKLSYMGCGGVYYKDDYTTHKKFGGLSSVGGEHQPGGKEWWGQLLPGTDTMRQVNETEWAIHCGNYPNDINVYGISACSDNSGTYGDSSNSEQARDEGGYCWCKTTSAVDTDDIEYTVSGTPWVFASDLTNTASCAGSCAYYCAHNAASSRTIGLLDFYVFRSAVFGVTLDN